jgi:hypothetical protein
MFEIYIAAFACAVVGCLAAIAGQQHERRRWERRLLERAGLLDTQATKASPSSDRMDRLEQAVDAIALELERVGEGQRFVTKILSERRRDDRTPPSPQPGAVRAVRPPTA